MWLSKLTSGLEADMVNLEIAFVKSHTGLQLEDHEGP